jgi:hypothetical protein
VSKSNPDAFPAHGNHCRKSAGVQIGLAYDLLTSSIVSHGLHAATEQNKSIGKNPCPTKGLLREG